MGVEKMPPQRECSMERVSKLEQPHCLFFVRLQMLFNRSFAVLVLLRPGRL